MKRTKLIAPILSGVGLLGLPSGLISLVSCGNKSTLKEVEQSAFKISGGILSGFNTSIDVSKYDTLRIPSGVRVIAKNSFKGWFTKGHGEDTLNNNIKTIILPSGIKYIEDGAFEDCNGITTLDLTAWTEEDIRDTKIQNREIINSSSNETGTAFKGWSAKRGVIKYNSKISESAQQQSKEKLVEGGLYYNWKETGEDPLASGTEVHIMSFNDLHGAVPGFGDDYFNKNSGKNAGLIRMAQDMAIVKNKSPGSIIVSAGDTNAGESFSTCKQADTLYPVLKAMDVRYSAVGNHGWDYGLDKLTGKHFDKLARTSKTEGNWFLASNILQKNDQQWTIPEDYTWDYNKEEDYTLWNNLRVKWADPYKIVDLDGHKVCLIGLTTHDTTTDGNKAALTTTRFFHKKNYTTAIGFSKKLCKQQLGDDEYAKIETFILLTHCDSAPVGDNPTVIEDTGEAACIAKEASTTTNSHIDGIISAHSHKVVAGTVANEETGKQIWIGQAEQSGRKWLDTTLTFDDSKPVGQRFLSVRMEVKEPYIPSVYDEKAKAQKPYFPDAAKQLDDICKNTRYPSVKKVVEEYNKQKVIAKQELAQPVGKVDHNGLEYWYYDEGRQLGTQWYQSPTLVEPLGAWATGAQTYMVNEWCKDDIDNEKMLPCSISLNNLDSFKTSIPKVEEGQVSNMTKDFIYSLHPYENKIWYGCLTPYQLRQYINYLLDGGNKFNYDEKWVYLDSEDLKTAKPVNFYYELKDASEQEKPENIIQWGEKEEINDPRTGVEKVTRGVSTSCGCLQFHGLSFSVEPTGRTYEQEPGNVVQIYKLKEDANNLIRIYNPKKDGCLFEEPSTWQAISEIEESQCPYIPITISSFCWQGGNAQNRMLNHWFEHNYNKELEAGNSALAEKIKCRQLNPFYTTRLTAQEYAKIINDQSKMLNYYLFPQGKEEFVKQLIKKVV